MNRRLHRLLARMDVTRKGARRVAEIVDTGVAILHEEGFTALTKRRIAARLGISHGNVSYYFPNREALWQAVIEYELRGYLDRHDPHNRPLLGNPRLEFDAFVLRRIDEYRDRRMRSFLSQVSAFAEVNPVIAMLRDEVCEAVYQETLARVSALVPQQEERALRSRVLAIMALLDGLRVVAVYRPDALVNGDSFPRYVVEWASRIARGDAREP